MSARRARAEDRAKADAEAAEMLLTHDKCRVCGGTGVYADRFAVVDCDACSATGWVKRTETTR